MTFIVTSNAAFTIDSLISHLGSEFAVKDLGYYPIS